MNVQKNISKFLKMVLWIIFFCCFFQNEMSAKTSIDAVLEYEQCNMMLDKTQIKNIQKLWKNICIFITDSSGMTTILAKNNNEYWISLIHENTLKFLKKNYYRWEKVNIKLEWTYKKITQNLQFKSTQKYNTLIWRYKIIFLWDSVLQKKNFILLQKFCTFSSFNIDRCTNKKYFTYMKKVEKTLSQKILKKNIILKSSYVILQKEIAKIQKISVKIRGLEEHYTDKYWILLVLKMIQYRMHIYTLVLNNRLGDLDFDSFLEENNIHYIDKVLVWDLYISQSQEYTYFYYKNHKINTLPNNTSHFDDEIISSDSQLINYSEYLQDKIREKYSAEYVKSTDEKIIFIRKKYSTREKYLLFDTENKKIFTFYWNIQTSWKKPNWRKK